MKKIQQFKQDLKKLASEISEYRHNVKETQRGNRSGYCSWTLSKMSRDFRHRHIAYCLMRGTPYEQIEPKVHDGNEPCWIAIAGHKDTYQEVLEEVVDASTAVCTGP